MSLKARVDQVEARIKGNGSQEPIDWEAFGDIGVLTRDCIILFLTNSKFGEWSEAHIHQLMRMGGFALNNLTEVRTVTTGQRESVRQLMADPEYRGFGWSEVKHPKALELYRLCESRGWVDSGSR